MSAYSLVNALSGDAANVCASAHHAAFAKWFDARRKARLAQIFHERVSGVATPHRKDAARHERVSRALECRFRIDARVRSEARPLRTVVDVEEDRAQARWGRALDEIRNVTSFESNAWIAQRVTDELARFVLRNVDHGIELLAHDDLRRVRIERAAERGAEAE